jgi:hypothetical protein
MENTYPHDTAAASFRSALQQTANGKPVASIDRTLSLVIDHRAVRRQYSETNTGDSDPPTSVWWG